MPEFPAEILRRLFGKISGPVEPEIGIQVPGRPQPFHVGREQLGIIGDHRAVVVVVTFFLVEVIRKAGVEDRVHPFIQQAFHVPVGQLGRIADGIGWDGMLPGLVQSPAGFRRQHHLEPQAGEEGVPEGQVLIHIEHHRDPDASGVCRRAPAGQGKTVVHARQSAQPFVFHRTRLGMSFWRPLPRGRLAAVAGNKAPPATETVDSQQAVVAAQAALGSLGSMFEALQLLRASGWRNVRPPIFPCAAWSRGMGCAIGAHDPRDGGTDDLRPAPAQAPEHGIVEEGAALDHDMAAQLLRAGGTDDLQMAFLTMLMDKPAEISSTEAPSFWACLTEEFMNTVQREPRSTGCSAIRPSFEKAAIS